MFQSDFCENLTEFYQITLKILVNLTDFSPPVMSCMSGFYCGDCISSNISEIDCEINLLCVAHRRDWTGPVVKHCIIEVA